VKITVITVVFNRTETVGQAVESVLSQSHPDVEHIVQDGGSTDGTLEVLRRVDDPRMQIVSEPDGGIYDALNRAIARATGDVVGVMHSDDFFAHERILERVATVFGDPSVDGVYGDLDYVSADDPSRVIRHWRAGTYTRSKLRYGWMPPHPTLYLRRQAFDQWGVYDRSYRIAADYEAMLRWLVQGELKLAYIPEVMVKMRVGGESNGSVRRIVRKSQEDLRAVRAHKVGGLGTLTLKNMRKISQFIAK
jgi:glycosyltransferase